MTENRCNEIEELIQLKMDGELDSAGAETLERHLAVCAHCRTVAEQYDSLNDSLLFHIRVEDTVPDFVPQPSFLESLAETLGRIPAFFEQALSIKPRYQLALAAVAVMVLIVAVPVLQQPETSGPDTLSALDNADITVCAFAITSVKPSVKIGSGPGTMKEVPLDKTRSPANDDYIITGSTGSVELAYNSTSIVRVHSGSEVRLGQARLDISRGHVWMDHNGGDFEMLSPTARLGVMGTTFGMKVRTDGRTIAYCEKGQIWIMGMKDSAKTYVTAGRQITISPDGLAGTIAPFKPRKTRLVTTVKPDRPTGQDSGTFVSTGEPIQANTNTLLNIIDDTDFIYELYRKHHRRNPEKTELNTLLKALESGDFTRRDIENAVLDQKFFRKMSRKVNR